MSVASLWRGLPCVLVLAIVPGCSKEKPALVPAGGKVQWRGKPVADATVQFVPDFEKNKQGHTATGQTGADGSFHLQTPPHGEGAMVGVYRVTVAGYPGKHSFPAKFNRIDKTTLVVEIPPGGKNDLLLKLD